MRSIYLDPNTNDIDTSSFDIRLTNNDTEYYSQRIENTVKTVYGEYFLDITRGIPYYGAYGVVMKKNPDMQLIRSLLVSAITGIDGIARVDSIVMSFDNATRVLTADIRAVTTTGVVITREIAT